MHLFSYIDDNLRRKIVKFAVNPRVHTRVNSLSGMKHLFFQLHEDLFSKVTPEISIYHDCYSLVVIKYLKVTKVFFVSLLTIPEA